MPKEYCRTTLLKFIVNPPQRNPLITTVFYLSAPLRFCLLLFPLLGVLLGATSVSAEDKLAVTFELPPAPVAPESLVRYQESLPPITPSDLAAPETVINTGDMALRFAPDDVAMPVASSQPQGEQVGPIAEAFALDHATEDLLAAVPELEDWIYDGGSDSLVARTVGSAEGTRQSDGRKTTAYYGHTDPGNGVWNLGTFSYQHEAVSPEDADEKQLRRLQHQERQLKEKAAQWKVPMSMEVRLNGLDLANQAPLAALDKGGYIERLAEAYKQGKSGEEAIAWARTQAYFDPDRQNWDAPGLGNNPHSIQRDQERRMAAIDRALRAYKDENGGRIQFLQEVSIVGDRPTTANPLWDQSESIAIVDFSLTPVSGSEQAGSEQAIAPSSQIPATDFLEAPALEATASANDAIEPNDSLIFEGEQPVVAEELPADPQNQLTIPAALSAEVTVKAADETTPAEAATSIEIADDPKVSMRERETQNAQKKAFIRAEDSIVQPK